MSRVVGNRVDELMGSVGIDSLAARPMIQIGEKVPVHDCTDLRKIVGHVATGGYPDIIVWNSPGSAQRYLNALGLRYRETLEIDANGHSLMVYLDWHGNEARLKIVPDASLTVSMVTDKIIAGDVPMWIAKAAKLVIQFQPKDLRREVCRAVPRDSNIEEFRLVAFRCHSAASNP